MMGSVIQYCNTDLELMSSHDLTALAAALTLRGVEPLHGVSRIDDTSWQTWFETMPTFHTEPEPNIAAMLDAVESLPPELRADWDGCTTRIFNLGYDCGDEPWAFNQSLSAGLLARIAAAGASLTITLYPHREDPPHVESGTDEDHSEI